MQLMMRWSAVALVAVWAVGCQSPTQVTFDITTDIPCDRVNGTSITVGLLGETEAADPREVIRQCRQDGTVGIIGTYAVVPRSKKDVVASVKVAVAVGDDVDVTADCTAANKYQGCTVARRQISFLTGRTLTVPIEVFLICKGVSCDENSTCNRAGRCIASRVNEKECTLSGVCSTLVTTPGQGLPCFNDGTNEPLFCSGDTSWCTRDTTGLRVCAVAPGGTGVSFQCRDNADCGANMNCVAGINGILAVCVPSTTTSNTNLRIGSVTITDASPTNHPALSLSYTGVSGDIAQTCVLENSAVASDCVWKTGTAPPTSYEPRLTSGSLLLGVYLKSRTGQVSAVAISNQVLVDRVSPSLQWVSPDGGEVWPSNSMQSVQWQASDDQPLPASPAGLEVSTDDGVSFVPVAAPLPNAPYTWSTGALNSGKVKLRLTVTDAASNQSSLVSNVFTVGTPTLSITSLQVNSGADATNDPQLRLTWGSVSAPFTRYCINVNDTQVSSCSWVTASTLPSTFMAGNADGTLTLTAWVQNGDGTTSTPVTANAIVLDRVLPMAAWVTPAGGEVWNGVPHLLSWTASDARGFGATPIVLELSTDNGTTWAALAGPLSNSPSTYTWQPGALNSTQVRLRLTATDAAGNQARVISSAFSLDATVPSIASLSLNAGAAATNNATLNLTWGAVTDTFTSLCLSLNDPDVANCLWAPATSLPATYALGGADGSKTLTAWVRDSAGNVSTVVTSNTIVLDRVPPAVTWVSPAGAETWATGVPATLSWTANDTRALAATPITIELSTNNGTSWAPLIGPVSNSPSTTQWTPSGINSAQVKLRLTAVDAAGNSTQLVSNTFSVTPITPTLASVQLNAGNGLSNSTSMSLTFGATNNTFNRYCLNINDTNVTNCNWVTSPTLPTSVTVPTGDGNKVAYVWLQNSIGTNSTMVTSNTVVLDQTVPTATLTSPLGGELWSTGSSRLITWAASDSRQLATTPIQLQVSTDNGATFTALAGPLANTLTYTWSPATTTSTQVKVRLIVTDAAGNTAQATSAAFSLTPLTWSPIANNWGSINISTLGDFVDLTLTNTGNTTVTGCAVPALSQSTDFQIVADACGTTDLAPLASCVVKVRSQPQALGVKTATLTRNCGAAGTAGADLLVTGSGTIPTRWNVTTLDLGQVRVGKSSFTADLYFQNTGSVSATGCGAPTLSNTTDFTLVTDECGSAPTGSFDQCRVRVRANPQAAGNASTDVSRTCQGLTRIATLSVAGMSVFPTQIAGGIDHECARMSDGTVRCWGYSGSGQMGANGSTAPRIAVTVPGLANVTAVAAGGYSTCAILNDSTVRCWGDNTYGGLGNGTTVGGPVPVVVQGLTGVTSLTMGQSFVCARLSDQTVKCWGHNPFGQLGDGTVVSRNVPTTVPGLTGVVSLSAGTNHTCALIVSGGVKCWGYNGNSQLGVVGGSTFSSPVDVPGVSGATAVEAGATHTCARLLDGSVKCWGANPSGQLGDGTFTDRPTAVTVPGWANATSLRTGVFHTCATFADQTVKCAGSNIYGQVGDQTTLNRATPTPVSGVTGVSQLSGNGYWHQCALLSDASVRCWGGLTSNGYLGMMGDGATSFRRTPVVHPSLTTVTAISNNVGSVCAVLADQSIRCWGDNSLGQLGDGTTINRSTPVQVVGITNAVSVFQGGLNFTCALLADRSVLCWGRGGYLGDGTGIFSTTPTAVQVPNTVVSLAVGHQHACVALASGAVHCWGVNGSGQLGDGTLVNRQAPVQVPGIVNAIAVSAGYDFSCALLSDKTMQCWGENTYNQLGDNTTTTRGTPAPVQQLSDVSSMTSAHLSSCAILGDQTMKCWGYNAYGNLGLGTTTGAPVPTQVRTISGVTRVSLAQNSGCALLSDSSTWCWGINVVGTIGNGTETLSTRPTPLPGLGPSTALSVSDTSTFGRCAIRAPGIPVCWATITAARPVTPS